MVEKPNTDGEKAVLAALKKSTQLSASILKRCVQEGREYFQSNPGLLAKVTERIEKGCELTTAGNDRVANIVQRHAIDLILQEDYQVFKRSQSLRKALLAYRDHEQNVLNPLLEP